MIKILSAEQTRKADEYTITHEPISSIHLMERASKAFMERFLLRYDQPREVLVFCGSGNNGGDGLAIARLLLEHGYPVNTWVVTSNSYTSDFLINRDRLASLVEVKEIADKEDIPSITQNVLVIDALFGSGLSRSIEGIHASVIQQINNSGAEVVSVDIPSGIYADHPSNGAQIIRADHCISFQFPKLAFLMPENSHYIQSWEIADIGLHPQVIDATSTYCKLIEFSDVAKILKPREKFSHKGSFGRAMIIAGSYGKIGAAVMSSRSCLRSGIGLLTAYVPECGYTIMQSSVPELMVETDGEHEFLAYPPIMEEMDVVGIGPGLGTHKLTAQLLGEILRSYSKPMVLDADALNIISDHREYLGLIPKGSILTPHVKEFERITAPPRDNFHRLELLSKLSADHNLTVILKGAHSVIADPQGNLYFNSTGNPGMATAGSGDVLTGIITALLPKYGSLDAAIAAVYLHGLSGDLAGEKLGQESLIAGDLIDYLPLAFKKF